MGREGRGRLSSLDLAPDCAQDDIFWAFAELNKRQRTQAEILFDLNARLIARGVDPISKSAFNRASVRAAKAAAKTAESRALFEGIAPQFTPDRIDQSNIVISELIKMLIADVLEQDNLGSKNAMELARAYMAVIQGQRASSARRAALEKEFADQAGKAIDAVSKETGLTAEQAAQIRRDVLGVRAIKK